MDIRMLKALTLKAALTFALLVAIGLPGLAQTRKHSSGHPTARANTFANLAAGDTVAVRYASQGCFHSIMFDLVFTKGDAVTATIYRVQATWNADDTPGTEKRERVGVVVLDAKDIKGLDRLLAFYRAKPDDHCTTRDMIRIAWNRHGTAPIAESIVDGSCETHSMQGIVTFDALANRLFAEDR
jgi:hypothetical protein